MQSGTPSKVKVVNSAVTTYGEELGDPTTPRKTSSPLIWRLFRCRGFHPDSIEYLYWNAFMLLPLLFTGTVMPCAAGMGRSLRALRLHCEELRMAARLAANAVKYAK